MKYFILFKSGRLASAVKIQSNHSYRNDTDSYMADNTEYCYAERIYTCETADYYEQRISYTLPTFYSYRPENGCWFVDRNIKCIIAIDEKENEDMNKLQSTDFNAGMLYYNIEKLMGTMLKQNHNMIVMEYSLPRIQVLPCVDGTDNDLIVSTIKHKALSQFNNVYGNKFTLKFECVDSIKPYITFKYSITRKEEVKEMTIEEIEKKLGHKIKIVGE